ncbi:MAG: hypothetical protein CMJ36_04410 [Phycisphaerae bacterium]|nr:hypothetical protein [Phycisphaerae bacterium]|tara:strand:+ start:132 stop:317 length:186 start_codon:yes stop_codon:yes gene_type:complete
MRKVILYRVFFFILAMAGAAIFQTMTGVSAFKVFLITLGIVLLGRFAFILMTHSYDEQPDD